MNYLDRNEFNFEPSPKVVEAIKSFDPKSLCFYTRIYDQGKKSVISVRVGEIYNVPEEQVLLAYGGEDILKNAIHYFLMNGQNKTILIPEFSWWYYMSYALYAGLSQYLIPADEDIAQSANTAVDTIFPNFIFLVFMLFPPVFKFPYYVYIGVFRG